MREELEDPPLDGKEEAVEEEKEEEEREEEKEEEGEEEEKWPDDSPAGYGEQEEKCFWKDEITENFHLWLENLEDRPDVSQTDAEDEPDLYSFYEQLCILRSEFRKNSRRSHETFSQFGEHLEGFQGVLDSLTQRIETLYQEREGAEFMARQGLLLQMVEIFERLRWFSEKLEELRADAQQGSAVFLPALLERIRQIFTGTRKDHSGLLDSISEGFSLTLSHFEEFLAGERVTRIKAAGTVFDPSVMIAVGTVETEACPPNTVFEEISGGYLCGRHILKLAKVTVAKRKETSAWKPSSASTWEQPIQK